MDTGLLIARMVFGLVMAAHGSQKLFGWFGGYGLAGTAGFFESAGLPAGPVVRRARRPARDNRPGCWSRLGLLGPLGPALIVSVMIVAMATVHWQHGLFAQNNGIEVPLLYRRGGRWRIALTGNGALFAGRRARPVLAGRGGLGGARPRGPGRIREPGDPQDHAGRGARLNERQTRRTRRSRRQVYKMLRALRVLRVCI